MGSDPLPQMGTFQFHFSAVLLNPVLDEMKVKMDRNKKANIFQGLLR